MSRDALHITPTRLRLLRQVADGMVRRVSAGHSVAEVPSGKSWSVTARIAELEVAGLVQQPSPDRHWRLTPARQHIIASHGVGVTVR